MRLVLITLLVLGAGCRKKATPPEESAPAMVVEAPEAAPVRTQDEAIQEIIRNFQRLHFSFDSTDLVDESEAALSANAKILQDFAKLRVEVQGHADERGTTDYNLALGQRRAKVILDRLVRMGVPDGRITIVSYGEERPLDSSSNTTAWSKNRRAEFRVLRPTPDAKVGGTTD